MPRFQPKRYEQILPQMLARTVTRAGLSDVGDSAFTKHILAAVSRSLDELYYQATLLRTVFSIDSAVGPDLDARAAEIQPGDLTRLPSVAAAGNVTFGRAVVSGSVNILTGTQVKTADGITFATAADATLSGSTVSAPIVAVLPGVSGNVVAGSIVSFVQKPAGVDTVTNVAATTSGQDQEQDDPFRARLKQYVSGLARSTVAALEACVLGVQNPATGATILFASAVEDPVNLGNVTLYIDDGTGDAQSIASVTGEIVTAGLSGNNTAVGGETRLFTNNKPLNLIPPFTLVSANLTTGVNRGTLTRGTQYTVDATSGLIVFNPALVAGEQITASYTYFTGLIQLAQRVVDGDPNNRTAYPGYRAAGVRVVVASPTVTLISIAATLTIADGYDTTSTEASVQTALISYVNGLSISQDVLLAQLFRVVMSVPGVTNVVFTSPKADTIIGDATLARTQPTSVVVT